MTAALIDGKKLAAEVREKVRQQVAEDVASGAEAPHLAAVLVGDDAASAVYVRNKQKDCDQVGIQSTLHRLSAETTEAELIALIDQLNADSSVHAILVQLPLPKQIDEQKVLDRVTPLKDVDCFHPENVGLMTQGRPRFLPCTPSGCQQLLQHAGINTSGAHVVVLGRSEIVGKPMGMMMVQRGEGADSTVTICHSRTKNLADIVSQADIVIAAIGKANFVTAEMIKPGAAVIDVGINRVDNKLVGDVDFEAVSQVAAAITPVPGGVGPMTRANLLLNALTAARLQRKAASQD